MHITYVIVSSTTMYNTSVPARLSTMYLATLIFLFLAVSIQFQVATSKFLRFGIPEVLNAGTHAVLNEEYRQQSNLIEELRKQLIRSSIKEFNELFLPQYAYGIDKLPDIKVIFPGLVYAAKVEFMPTACQVYTPGLFTSEECPDLPEIPAVECHAVYYIRRELLLTCRRAFPYLRQPTPFLEPLPVVQSLSVPVPLSVPTVNPLPVVARLPVLIVNSLPIEEPLPVPFFKAAAFRSLKPLPFDEPVPVVNPLPVIEPLPIPVEEPVPVTRSVPNPVVEPINVVEPEPALGPIPFPVVVENDSVEEPATLFL